MTDSNGQVVQLSTHLKVTNNNSFPLEDMFDGVPYTFEPGKPLTIPPDAAFHIFAWQPGVDMKVVEKHICKRWGWNTPDMQKGDAEFFFKSLAFKPITFKMVEVVEKEEVETEPEPAPKVPLRARPQLESGAATP